MMQFIRTHFEDQISIIPGLIKGKVFPDSCYIKTADFTKTRTKTIPNFVKKGGFD